MGFQKQDVFPPIISLSSAICKLERLPPGTMVIQGMPGIGASDGGTEWGSLADAGHRAPGCRLIASPPPASSRRRPGSGRPAGPGVCRGGRGTFTWCRSLSSRCWCPAGSWVPGYSPGCAPPYWRAARCAAGQPTFRLCFHRPPTRGHWSAVVLTRPGAGPAVGCLRARAREGHSAVLGAGPEVKGRPAPRGGLLRRRREAGRRRVARGFLRPGWLLALRAPSLAAEPGAFPGICVHAGEFISLIVRHFNLGRLVMEQRSGRCGVSYKTNLLLSNGGVWECVWEGTYSTFIVNSGS